MAQKHGDLAWYFDGSCGGDLGLRASSLEPCYGGTSDPITQGQIDAAKRHREICEGLALLDADTYRVLRATHTPLPPSIETELSKGLGPDSVHLARLLCHAMGLDTLLSLLAQRAASGAKAREKRDEATRTLAKAKEEAEKRAAKAVAAYQSAAKQATADRKEVSRAQRRQSVRRIFEAA